VWRRNSSALEHALTGKPPATEPSAPTATPWPWRIDRPRLFVAPGPVNEIIMNAGLLGTAASSSASVGRRPLVGSAGVAQIGLEGKPPVVVIQAPLGAPAARAA